MIKRLLFLTCIALVATWVLRTYFVDTISVASGSMLPTLPVGNHYLVNRLVYRIHAPERGDIIVFRSPVDDETGFIKRVIGIPGDVIELNDKRVLLNGKVLDEPYVQYMRASERLTGDNLGPVTVPDGKFFVLGDNRDESYDSTTWKNLKTGERIYFLPLDHIKGRLIQLT